MFCALEKPCPLVCAVFAAALSAVAAPGPAAGLSQRPRTARLRWPVVQNVVPSRMNSGRLRWMMPLRCWNGKIADLYAASDAFSEDFGNDAFNVCPAVVSGIVLNSFRESSVTKILVELIDKIGGYALPEKFLHAKELIEGEREHFEFNVSSRQLRDKLSAQEIGIRTGDEDGVSAFDAESIDYFFEVLYILDFIDEEICRSRGRCLFVDEPFKAVGGRDGSVWAAVKIKIDNVRIILSAFPHLFGNCFHKAGFSATPDAGNYLYEASVLIKSANLAEVVLSPVVVHGGQYSKSVAKWQVKGVKFERLLKNTPLNREFAPRRPPETLKLRVSAQKFKAFSHID